MKSSAIGIAVVFIGTSFLIFAGLSMISQVPNPDVGSDEYDQFTSLSTIIEIGYSGYYVVLLIIIIVAIIAAFKIGGKI